MMGLSGGWKSSALTESSHRGAKQPNSSHHTTPTLSRHAAINSNKQLDASCRSTQCVRWPYVDSEASLAGPGSALCVSCGSMITMIDSGDSGECYTTMVYNAAKMVRQ